MARPIILSNSELHVGINKYGLVHDFYYPYVGLENHAAGRSLRHKVGIWVDGQISWLDDESWQFSFKPMVSSLVGHFIARNEELSISLQFDDFVASEANIFFRNIHIVNHSENGRHIRLFMHQAFEIGDSRSNTDTAQYLPDSDAILHYRGRRAFVISGSTLDGKPFDQRSIGLFGIEGKEGTFRDADDGELSNGDVEHGRVDSTIRFSLEIAARSSSRVHYWISCGTSVREAVSTHSDIQKKNLLSYEQTTHKHWHAWLEPADKHLLMVPIKYRSLFATSALVIKSHIDKRGAIIASTDSAMLKQSRDAYSYCWPRDGAYALWPLIRMGYTKEPLSFFEFCRDSLHPRGYLAHKYTSDGAVGPSWHPYAHGNRTSPPIQEDETALTLFMYGEFYQTAPLAADLPTFYAPLVKQMANFLTSYIDQSTGLPLPSYELWEERYMVSTYTVAIVVAALRSAAELADASKDPESAVNWRNQADDMQKAAHERLFSESRQSLVKGLVLDNDSYRQDETVDISSFYGAFIFGLYKTESDQITKTLAAIEQSLAHEHSVGLPRYENDNYHRASPDSRPNDWFITTLWRAQYYLEIGKNDQAYAILDWVLEGVGEGNMLAEQVNAETGQSLLLSPLVWSHAEVLSTLLDTRNAS